MREKSQKQKRAVGPKLRVILNIVLGAFVLLCLNAVYLLGVRVLEYQTNQLYQDHVYQLMFLGHLALGLVVILPVVIFGIMHWSNTRHRRPSPTKKLGTLLLVIATLILLSGLMLVRLDGFEAIEVRDPARRDIIWWIHVVTPLLAIWCFILHRLTGPKLKWRRGAQIMGGSLGLALAILLLWLPDPRGAAQQPETGDAYFEPSLARTASGGFIPEASLMNDAYCEECHAETHARWKESSHKFSSFNNIFYRFSVRETRRKALEKEGSVQDARFCAGCHDPVPFFSGAFDDPNYDDVNHPTAHAGITCTVCHAITEVRSVRGNADYVIEEPIQYPFATSEVAGLRWLSNQLIKSKPGMHKKTFLKPFHKEAEFCGTCHKAHLPQEVNDYRWLRGQNHFDSYHLSGVSGHGVQSFYYPDTAQENCNGCHMTHRPSDDFGAKSLEGREGLYVRDHLFPSANTALPALRDAPAWVNEAHEAMLKDTVRIDLFGVRKGDDLRGELIAPLDTKEFQFEAGQQYVLDIVLRTLKMGHHLTQGTADSNQLWVEVTAGDDAGPFASSGELDEDRRVDPFAHFINSYVLDRNGERIDRRNAEDIYVALYNHQIPPGAADVLHYRLSIPETVNGNVWVRARVRYRKFDQTYVDYVFPEGLEEGLPIVDIADVRFDSKDYRASSLETPEWVRWNDFGIANLRKPKSGNANYELDSAGAAFRKVAKLGRPEAWLNVARVHLKDRKFDEAAEALEKARPYRAEIAHWTFDWLAGLINLENGHVLEAVENFEAALAPTKATVERGFDFTQDYRLLNELATAYFELAKQVPANAEEGLRDELYREAESKLKRVLSLDPENARAHYTLFLLESRRGNDSGADRHRLAYERYRVDDQAREHTVPKHRAANAAARAATEALVIYSLQ